jgi:hypothetical protein
MRSIFPIIAAAIMSSCSASDDSAAEIEAPRNAQPIPSYQVERSNDQTVLIWNNTRYTFLEPKGAAQQGTKGIVGDWAQELAVKFGLSDGMKGERIAVECILAPNVPKIDDGPARLCQVPSHITGTPFGPIVFEESDWTTLNADLHRLFPNDDTILFGIERSVLIFGIVDKTENFNLSNHNFVTVEGWKVIGRKNDYGSLAIDAWASAQAGIDISSGLKTK